MPYFVEAPEVIPSAGNKPKVIQEFFGLARTGTDSLSIARMESPTGWVEPGQCPEFDEYTVVLKGMLRCRFQQSHVDVHAGQAILVEAGEWVQYSTPGPEGATYIAVCRPAFTPARAQRDEG
jgi:mannose-6-phosphate isomerase-like protein (cupin superfamily)